MKEGSTILINSSLKKSMQCLMRKNEAQKLSRYFLRNPRSYKTLTLLRLSHRHLTVRSLTFNGYEVYLTTVRSVT